MEVSENQEDLEKLKEIIQDRERIIMESSKELEYYKSGKIKLISILVKI
jgi:hypothetical protein